jgi:hypothetical protein
MKVHSALGLEYRVDLPAKEMVGVELESIEKLHPIPAAQRLSYSELSGNMRGLLMMLT